MRRSHCQDDERELSDPVFRLAPLGVLGRNQQQGREMFIVGPRVPEASSRLLGAVVHSERRASLSVRPLFARRAQGSLRKRPHGHGHRLGVLQSDNVADREVADHGRGRRVPHPPKGLEQGRPARGRPCHARGQLRGQLGAQGV